MKNLSKTENKEALVESMKVISIPLFKYSVVVVKTNSIVESCKARDLPTFEEEASIGALTTCKDESIAYMLFNKELNVGTISHECYHALNRMFEWIGVETHDEEITAYTLGYLVNETHKFLTDEKGNK